MSNIKALPYASTAAVLAAFAAGAKFEVAYAFGHTAPEPVLDMMTGGTGGLAVKTATRTWSGFRADGSCPYYSARLALAVDQKRPSQFDLAKFYAGTDYHNPKTGEVVCGIHVYGGAKGDTVVEVEFQSGRISKNYRVDGTHRHQANRDLVPGLPVPKVRTVRVEVAVKNDGSFDSRVALAELFRPKRDAGAIVGLGNRIVYSHEFDIPA